MKNSIFRLISIIAILNGIFGLVYRPLLAISSPETISLTTIQYILSTWILIYGGYQTLRRKINGPKLLRIFFCIETIKTILTVLLIGIMFLIFGNKFALNPELNGEKIPSEGFLSTYLYLYVAFYVAFYILSFVFLSQKNVAEDFLADSPQQSERVGKILSVVAPGLGQAFVGKYWSGIIRFLIFYGLLSGLNFSISIEPNLLQLDVQLINQLNENIIKLFIWALFSHDDWALAREELKNQQEQTAQVTIEEPSA